MLDALVQEWTAACQRTILHPALDEKQLLGETVHALSFLPERLPEQGGSFACSENNLYTSNYRSAC